MGQLIADSKAYIGAPIHSSVSGKIEDIMSSLGTMDKTIVIETDKKQELWEGASPVKNVKKYAPQKQLR